MKRERYLIVLLLVLCCFIACSMAEESTELLAAANPYPTREIPVNGSIYVASFPTGATISIDNVQRGLTNQIVANIRPGTHNLTLSKSGYQNVTVPFEVKAGESKVLAPVTLASGGGTDGQKGSIYVSSIPTNATISLDGVGKGLTDKLVTNVAAGNHTLTLSKTGYQAKTVRVEVSAGEQKVLAPITLIPVNGTGAPNGSLFVSSIPTNATIFLDGVNRGTTDMLVSNVSAGTHNLTLNKTGYQNKTVLVEVNASEDKVLDPMPLTAVTGPDGGNASVYVASVPSGATIFLDGIGKGQTDRLVTNVTPGNHTLTLSKTGYQTKTVPFAVSAGEQKVLAPITLSPGNATDGQKGSIYVSSFPTGATISLDGVGKGLTNRLVTNVTAGNHTLTLSKTGYQAKTIKVEVRAGETKVLAPITLSQGTGGEMGNGSVYVASIPSNATIYLDGVMRGRTDGLVINVTAGTHNLTLNKTGYQNRTVPVEIQAGEQKVLAPITLLASDGTDGQMGSIYVSSVPTNATITLDGVGKGLTDRLVTNVTPGNHTLRLSKAGYQAKTVQVTVEAGEQKVLSPLVLTPVNATDGTKGSLFVSSIPTNATIFLDGANKGQTDILITNVPAGNHTLRLSKAGFQNVTVQVALAAGEDKVLTPITLTPGNETAASNGSVFISSIPTNATIFLDGVNRGLTDGLVSNVTAGSHNLTLTKAGYQNKTVQFGIEAGEQKVLAPITLTQSNVTDGQKGAIYVSSIPTGATISLDGVNKGVTNRLVTNVTAGNHTLTLSKSGYQAKTVQVTVEVGEQKVLSPISLSQGSGPQSVNGSVYVASIPSNATILIDGVAKGVTNKLVTGIPAGTHNLTLAKVGYEATTIWVDIVAGVNKVLGAISLQRI